MLQTYHRDRTFLETLRSPVHKKASIDPREVKVEPWRAHGECMSGKTRIRKEQKNTPHPARASSSANMGVPTFKHVKNILQNHPAMKQTCCQTCVGKNHPDKASSTHSGRQNKGNANRASQAQTWRQSKEMQGRRCWPRHLTHRDSLQDK